MQKRILVSLNLSLLVILVAIILYFYPVIENEGVDPDKQYTLLLNKPEPEQSLLIRNENAVAHDNKPQVAFLVSDLGINREITDKVLDTLPKDVAFGFSLYSENLESNLDKASDHDILLHLPIHHPEKPLETLLALDGHVQNEENLRRLSIFLSQGNNDYIGVYTDQSFSFNKAMTYEIMTNLRERGKVLCYSGCDKITKYTASQEGVGFASPDLVISYDFDKTLIEERLRSIALIHRFQQRVLVLVQPSAIAIDALSDFLKKEHDFQVVSIAEMVQNIE